MKRITWKVEKRKLADLKPHPKNPRQFTEKGMKDLENSINSIGFMQPININQDGLIEEWRNVVGYEDRYQISNLGNVRSILEYDINYGYKECNKIKKLILHQTGCYVVSLYLGNKKFKTKRVHRLVAEAFLEKIENKNQVNHKDGNRLNNNLNNLEWCNNSENILHSYRVLNRKNAMLGKVGKLHKLSKAIKLTNIKTTEIFNFESINLLLSSKLGISKTSIYRALSSQSKIACNYKVELIN